LLVVLNVALLLMLVGAGLLVDSVGLRPVMIGAPVLLSLSLLALGTGINYRRTQIAVLCAGLAGTAIGTASVVLMPRALFGESEQVASLQLGLVFVALGSLVSAPLLEILFRTLGYRRTMAVLAFVCLLPAFLTAFISDEPLIRNGAANSVGFAGTVVQLFNDAAVLMGCIVFFIYVPLEGFVSVWTATQLAARGEPPRTASRLLFIFWTGMLFSRLGIAILQHDSGLRDTQPTLFIVLPALFVAVVLGNLAAVSRLERIGPGMFMLGLFMGPLYPMLVGLVFRTPAAHELPGTAYGLLCACGSLGGLALSPLVGYCARSRNQQIALLIPTFLALLLTGAALLFGLRAGYGGAL
jgi:hypothetical protein